MSRSTLKAVEVAIVVAAALSATVFFTWPLPQRISTHLVELGDSRLNAYIQAWVTHALTTAPAQLFNPNIYYPTKNALSGSENMLGNQWLFAPVYLLSGNPILATNLVILASFFLSALTMYLLVREVTGEPYAAAVAGLVYGFALPRVAQIDHMQLLSMQWIPLVVLFLYKFLLRKQASDLVGLIGFAIFQILTSLYLTYVCILIAGCYFAAVVLTKRDLISRRVVAGLALLAILAGSVAVPIGVHYQDWGRGALYSRNDLKEFALLGSADPRSSYLQVAGFPNHIYSSLLSRFESEELGWEKRLFMGFMPMALAALGVAYGWRLRRTRNGVWTDTDASVPGLGRLSLAVVVGSIFTSAVAYVLSLGPDLRMHGRPTGIVLPFALLQEYVPGMIAFRIPARFGLAVLFGVAVLAGLGFMQIVNSRWMANRRVLRTACLLFALLAISLEFRVTPIVVVPVTGPAQVAPEYQWLAGQRPGSVTLELPVSGPPGQPDPFEQAGYVYESVYHWQPLMNGYTGNPPQAFRQMLRVIQDVPDPKAVDALARAGLRYVLVHFDRLVSPQSEQWRDAVPTINLREVARFEDDAAIFEVIRPNSAADNR